MGVTHLVIYHGSYTPTRADLLATLADARRAVALAPRTRVAARDVDAFMRASAYDSKELLRIGSPQDSLNTISAAMQSKASRLRDLSAAIGLASIVAGPVICPLAAAALTHCHPLATVAFGVGGVLAGVLAGRGVEREASRLDQTSKRITDWTNLAALHHDQPQLRIDPREFVALR
ncbi:MAG: hypothetical protein EB084_09590 [Proteobacteria bacterium]|nr:hypothetical protein [Pseudomonadota bacterium]